MDEAEFDDFYTTSFHRLVGQLYAMVGDREEARDCVQEAFVKAWSQRRVLDRVQHPEAWVRTTAYRLAVSRWRRRRKDDRVRDRSQLRDQPTAPDETRVALVRALQQLPDDQRRALVLHHLCDLSVAAVAAETGAPVGTVKARLSRGRTALAALLGEPSDLAEGAGHA